MEFHKAVRTNLVVSLRLQQRRSGIFAGIPQHIDDPSPAHIRGEVGFQRVIQRPDLLLSFAEFIVQPLRQLGNVVLLALHTRLVGAHTHAHPAPDIDLRLLAGQRQRFFVCHRRIQRREIILQRHRYAACPIVEHGYAIQVHGNIVVDLHAHEQVGHRLHRQLATLLSTVPKAVRQADLRSPHSRAVPQHAQDGDRRHGIPVDPDLGHRARIRIDHHQPQKVRLSAVAAVARHRTALPVDAHEQDGGEVCLPSIGNAVHLNGLAIGVPLCVIPSRLRLGISRLQPPPRLIQQRDPRHQH